MGGWLLSVSVVFISLFVFGCDAESRNRCSASRAVNCSVCLQAGPNCAYCPDEVFPYERCDLLKNLQSHGCLQMVSVQGSMSTLENVQIDTNRNYAQVAPQQMTMTLLPGEERELVMEVFEPGRGPLDLYILMDFSNSMSDDLDNLKKMGDQLAKLVGTLSDDYTIGFGKFVDKVIEPQTDMRPSKLAQPWPNSDPPFSFRHVIPLTNNIKTFREILQRERISGNLDAPEGGFDAILQAAVCQSQIGWRNDTTHLLVFSTESAFHYEADGVNVLAGVLDRNDEKCHLDTGGSYTHATLQDYPSVPTLVRTLMKHNIIPVFAVTNHSLSYYERLLEYFPIAELGVLTDDSSNILHIIENAFKSIRSKISIQTEDRPKAINSQVLSATGGGDLRIQPGEIANVTVRLSARTEYNDKHVCSLSPNDRSGLLRVKPTTFSSALRIQTNVLCATCECEKNPIERAPRCNGNGALVCGVCRCYNKWMGPFCNCSAQFQSDAECISPNKTEPCSGRGDCVCGTCICHNPSQYDGPFCQYDKSQCQRYGGFLCNDRGGCLLGKCVCDDEWTGNSCECPLSNMTCRDNKGGLCNGRGVCKCGRCECEHTGLALGSTCEPNFQAQLGMCESRRSCVQCQAWKTGERKGDKCRDCPFKVVMVDELKERDKVIETCEYRDEDDDCTYYYTVDYPPNPTEKEHEVQVLKKKDCPPGGFLWLIPLIMFLMLLLGLLLLCCWKYCACCKACLARLLALCCPCCAKGRMVGFKEDHYMLRQSLLTSDHLDTPMVRTGPPKSTDVVRWKVKDNVHRPANHPQNQIQPNPKEMIDFPVSLRLNRQFSDNLSRLDARDTQVLRQEVEDNLNDVFRRIPGAQTVQKTRFRTQRNAGKRQNNTIVDTVLPAPRGSYNDIVNLTDKQVQSGNFSNLRVMPGYYTVATDRDATGAVELQEGVESVDVRVPLFIKDEDDAKKELLVEAIDVPLGIAKIGKRFVNITVIKENAKSIFTFLQPSYTFSRQDAVANIPISREIIEDGRTQVTYSSRDLTAKDKKDYVSVDGDMAYGPGETQKLVQVKLLQLAETDSLLDKQLKQFVLDLSNPRQGAKLGRIPRTTINIADKPDPSAITFKNNKQSFFVGDPVYNIPVIRTQGQENQSTMNWRVRNSSQLNQTGQLKFAPGEVEKNITLNPLSAQGPIKPETFELELFDPSANNAIRDKTQVDIIDMRGGDISKKTDMSFQQSAPSGRLHCPANIEATPIGPKNIRLNWKPQMGAKGYKVKYWIYGDPEAEAQVVDVKNTQAELTNLYPYCDYEMRVCAYNSQGDGEYSDIVQCQTLEDVPSEPGRLAFNVIGPTVTQLSWAEPAEPNGVITEYEVVYTPINENNKPTGPSKKVKIDNPKKRMLLIENLQPSQTYFYKVRASNKVGWGPYRDATINLASQPHRPMSIPIIPDIPIVDAEAGEEYDSFLMYSNEVLRSPTTGTRPSVSDMSEDQMINGKWDQKFMFPGGSSSLTRNISTSSTNYSVSPRPGGGNQSMETMTTYVSGKGGSAQHRQDMQFSGGLHTEDVILRKRSENRNYYDSDGIRDSIVMGDLTSGFSDLLSNSSFSQTTTTNYSLSSNFRNHTEDINDALQNLDRVLQDSRLPRGVPETPSRLVFSALGPTALKVSWQEPHCDTPVLGYRVLYQLLSGGEMKQMDVANPAQNSVVVQDLLPNQSYLFKVKAQSQEGWGPEREGVITIESTVDPKSPLSPVPGSSFTLSTPSAPGPLVFTALSPETLQLSWDKPRKPNGEILGYVVTCEQLHGGGDLRSFQVSGNAATSLTVSDLKENVPYKFKVQAQTTQGFGPEREGIITIESQDGGSMGQYSSQSLMRREVFNLPTQTSTHTSHTMFSEPFVTADGMMMSSRQVTQHMEVGGSVMRQMEMVQRGVTSTVTKRVEKQYYEA
uniref:Integrin beta n=1 Tax=Astyanax mexicanus TaxID=7994 RepID=A0A3B1JGI3_ASTMX